MPIRQPAAEKLAKKLMELRPPRMMALEPKFYEMMSRVIQLYVDMDELRQKMEATLKLTDTGGEKNG